MTTQTTHATVEIRISRTDLPRKGYPYGRTVYSVYVNGEERDAFYSKRIASEYADRLRKKGA